MDPEMTVWKKGSVVTGIELEVWRDIFGKIELVAPDTTRANEMRQVDSNWTMWGTTFIALKVDEAGV